MTSSTINIEEVLWAFKNLEPYNVINNAYKGNPLDGILVVMGIRMEKDRIQWKNDYLMIHDVMIKYEYIQDCQFSKTSLYKIFGFDEETIVQKILIGIPDSFSYYVYMY
jgi:hypothetical protein